MAFRASHVGIRGRSLLAAFLVYAFGLLPFLAASHSHAEESGQAAHSVCQLCQVSAQVYQAPAPAAAPAPVAVLPLLLPDDSPRVLHARPAPYESRGPPSA